MSNKLVSIGFFSRIWRYLSAISLVLFVSLFAYGIYLALIDSPPDMLQGDAARIMYVHVPCAWLALLIYSFMFVSSVMFLVWRNVFAALAARAVASLGMMFCFACIITGCIWGYPMWGAWWVWDARLTSMLVLLFFYVGYVCLDYVDMPDFRIRNAQAAMTVLGFVNIPIIKFSVNLWATLHQSSSIIKRGGPSVDPAMLRPLIVMFSALVAFSIFVSCIRVKTIMNVCAIKRIRTRDLADSW